jgi:enoyl-CoA hydratase/carnithine racemase
MVSGYIQTRVEGNVYYVTVNRPEKRNALTGEMVMEIAAAVRAADEHPGVRAVIVHGEGPMFSAGIDINSLGQSARNANGTNPARAVRRVADRLQDALHQIESTELPVIGAIHGRAMGMGLELALAFDLRVIGRGCKLSMPETRMGLVADVGGTTRLTKLIGPSRAKDMLMTAREVGAEEALMWGLADRVAADEEVLGAAAALAGQIAKNAPLAVGLSKFIVDQGDGLPKATQMAIERLAQSQLITTGDVVEAVTSFVQKREPDFKGK